MKILDAIDDIVEFRQFDRCDRCSKDCLNEDECRASFSAKVRSECYVKYFGGEDQANEYIHQNYMGVER